MLKVMQNGKPFSITVVTYDKRRKSGGKKMQYPEAILNTLPKPKQSGDRPATRMEALTQKTKAPNHSKNFTRNIRVLMDGHPTAIIRTIHPALVTIFNDQIVVP